MHARRCLTPRARSGRVRLPGRRPGAEEPARRDAAGAARHTRLRASPDRGGGGGGGAGGAAACARCSPGEPGGRGVGGGGAGSGGNPPPSAAPRVNNNIQSNFKRQNTVDTATIKENTPRYSGSRPATATATTSKTQQGKIGTGVFYFISFLWL